MPLEAIGCPLRSCSARKLRTVRQFMQHFRNVHVAGCHRVFQRLTEESEFSGFLQRYGVWRCTTHNSCFATHLAPTPRRDGLHRLKYSSCSRCGRNSAPAYVLPPPRVFIYPYAISPVPSVPDPDPVVIDLAPSSSRLNLPVFGDLATPLDPLALSRWGEALDSTYWALAVEFL